MQVEASQKQAEGKAQGNGALFCVCLAVRRKSCLMLRLILYCFASFRLALLCFALHCIAHLWNDTKANQKNALRHAAASQKHPKRMLQAS